MRWPLATLLHSESTMFKNLLVLLLGLLCFQSAYSTDYVISTYDAISNHSLVNMGQQMLRCQSIFQTQTHSSNVRIQRIASFSYDGGRRNDHARGMQMQERDIDMFEELSNSTVSRILLEWRRSGFYSDFEVERAFDLHRRLSPHRLKLISTESVESGRGFQYNAGTERFSITEGARFAALRIFDSSPRMRSYGRLRSVPEYTAFDNREIAEQVFPGFNLSSALADRNIARSRFTWSLGLGVVAGKQESALRTLFAQAADLLDLHYNHREFFNFGRMDFITSDDVDVVFYASEKLVPYYQQTLEINPLQRADGLPLYVEKNSKRYYIFHIKGSEFISKYFNLRFHQPLYGNTNGLRNESEIRQFYLQRLTRAYDQIPVDLYTILNIDDFFQSFEPLLVEFLVLHQTNQMTDENFFPLLARFLKLRRSLPDDVFEQTYSDNTRERVLNTLRQIFGEEQFREAGVLYFGMLEFLLRDPVQFLINRTSTSDNREGPQ